VFVERRPGRSRQELARDLSRELGWRRPNGGWGVRSARDLLTRLDELGVIRLPAPRRAQGRPRREVVEAAALLLSGDVGREDHSIAAGAGSVLTVRPIHASELLQWRAHIERFHYLGDAALVGASLRYVALLDGEWVALLSWGAAALRNGPRDRYVGWDDATRKANLHRVVNNARFLILARARRPHLASQILAANLRRLSRDWEKTYGHPIVLAETFVDVSRFLGTCYRASNWIPVGETKGWSKSGETYRFHGLPKAVWLYPLERDFKERLLRGAARCTRQETFMRIDVNRLPLHGEGGLFEILCSIPDKRKRRGVRHKLQSILATAISAVLSGARSITAIAEWAAEQSPETLTRLGSTRGKPPSERTYRRAFDSVDLEVLDRRTGAWVCAQQKLKTGMGIAIDGKTLRGSSEGDRSGVHLLSAIVHGSSVVVAQVPVDSKTNEITRVEPLLTDLDIEGVVVTADALLTQKKIASHLVQDKKADYLLTAKDNQPTLKQDIEDLGLDAFPPSAPDDGQGARADRNP
jgi:hypothetical protein